ncbi:glycosyltransferase family 4 protein [bacterium]|nr:glycosyltransferase family 4 protein [bacterium]
MSTNNKINITYLVSRLRRQGPMFQLYNIIKHLDTSRFHPQIITLSPETKDSLMDDFKNLSVDYTSLSLSRKTDMILGPGKLKSIFEKSPPDLIHVSGLRSTILCAYHLRSIPAVVTCRQTFDSMHYKLSGDPWLMSRIKTRFFSSACKKIDRVVAVSRAVKDSAKPELASRIQVIHNGVNQDVYKPSDPKTKAHMREKLGLPQDKLIFLSTGFLSELKDPITIIKGFLQSKQSRSSELILLGDGSLRQECSATADRVNNIRVVGFVDNVSDYLAASDVFVSGSLFEGCPNSVMEALAYGLAVILSDIPPHREILAFDSKAGVTFKVGDVDSLAEAIAQIDQHKCSIQSQAALRIVNDHLNARRMSLKYQQIYIELFNEHFGERNS